MVSQVMHRLRSVVPQRTINLDHPNNLDHKAAYTAHVDSLKRSGDYDKAMRTSIGGEFAAMGVMMRELLIMHGLTPASDVIDVGCGAGRLTKPLSTYLYGHYLGTDVVDELVEYARAEAHRPDWHFQVTSGLDIPAANNSADMVCFFSVFTHLLHEESYRYLHEAKRVLRPGGRIVFSFLEFSIPSHWLVFDLNLATVGQARHHNQFMSRDGITKWAQELGLEVVAMYDGDKPHIPLPHPVELESGLRYEDLGTLGQSVCVLQA
jgi:SAM-dependent methyltransferase